jgi:hypothetical protein
MTIRTRRQNDPSSRASTHADRPANPARTGTLPRSVEARMRGTSCAGEDPDAETTFLNRNKANIRPVLIP